MVVYNLRDGVLKWNTSCNGIKRKIIISGIDSNLL